MVRVRYLDTVTLPEQLAGEVGQERELEPWDAERLAGEGFVEIIGFIENAEPSEGDG